MNVEKSAGVNEEAASNFTPGQQERLHAAVQLLVDYLLDDLPLNWAKC